MSKKFLTVFALVALLVAAMAGAAFAAEGDVSGIVISADAENNVGDIQANAGTAYFVSGDSAPKITFSATLAFTDPEEPATVSADTTATNGTVVITADKTDYDGAATAEVTFTITDWDPANPIVIADLGVYDASDTVIGTPLATLTINPIELVVSADASDVAATEGRPAKTTPETVTFELFDTNDDAVVTTLGATDLAFAGAALSGDKVDANGLINAGTIATDYISADVAAVVATEDGSVVTFGVGAYGPGAAGQFKLAFVADAISFDLGGVVYVAGVDANKKLAEVSFDIAKSALKATPEKTLEFTLEEAADPVKVVVSTDSATIKSVDFYVVSGDTYDLIETAKTVKALTFTTADFADKSVDFYVAFNEAYEGVSHDVTIVASSDLGDKASFAVKVNDPQSGPGPVDEFNEDGTNKNQNSAKYYIINTAGTSADYTALYKTSDDLVVYMTFEQGDVPPVASIEPITPARAAASTGGAGNWKEASEMLTADNAGEVVDWTFQNITKGKYYYVVYDSNGDPIAVSGQITAFENLKDGGSYHSSSGVGCDAGFGAFALLGLAGAAALLRKKD